MKVRFRFNQEPYEETDMTVDEYNTWVAVAEPIARCFGYTVEIQKSDNVKSVNVAGEEKNC